MQLFPLILFGIATAFSPGPNNIMTSYTAFNFGFRKAIPTMLGVIIGWTLLIILLQLTSGAIFQKYTFIQTTIKILGSIYLLYMAYKLSFAGQTKDKKIDPKPVTFLNTFWFQFINPKSIIVGITSISLFIDTQNNYLRDFGSLETPSNPLFSAFFKLKILYSFPDDEILSNDLKEFLLLNFMRYT